MTRVLEKFRKPYSIMCWCKKGPVIEEKFSISKYLYGDLVVTRCDSNLLKNDLQGWNKISTRRSSSIISWGNICPSSTGYLIIIYSLLVLSGSFLFCIIFLFVITGSTTYSILFLINISSPNSGSTSCVYELPSNSGANSPFKSSFFFLSIFSSLSSFSLPPIS